MKRLWLKYLTNNHKYDIEHDDYRQVFLINMTLLSMLVVFLLFAILNIIRLDFQMLFINCAGFALSIIASIYFHLFNRVKFISIITVFIVMFISIIFLYNSKNCDYSFIWIIILPNILLSLFGIKYGLLAFSLFLTIFLIIFNPTDFINHTTSFYPSIANIICALIVLAAEIIYSEYIHIRTRDFLTKKSQELEVISETDRLTGLYNRLKLDESFDKLFQSRMDVFSIVFADIDQFKNVNDTYGHLKGDLVLKRIASIIKETCEETDIPGRWGGEEFLIICTFRNKASAKMLAENIRKKIEITDFDGIQNITISAGVTQYIKNDDSDTIVKRTDDALAKSKQSGKNKVIIF